MPRGVWESEQGQLVITRLVQLLTNLPILYRPL